MTTELSPEDFLNNLTPTTSINNTTTYHVRFKFTDRLIWATLGSTDFEIIKCTACQTFPELIGQEFQFYDVDGALVSPEFFGSFLNFSSIGVILTIKTAATCIQNIASLDFDGGNRSSETASPFSTYSKAYTGDTASCSTVTVPELHSSCTSFDDDLNSVSSSPSSGHRKNRAKSAAIAYNQVSDKELKNYFLSHPGGKEVINFYREKKTLDDPRRKRLVNIVVEHMLQYMPANTLPCTQTKIDYAKIIVSLFPNLRDKDSEEGYEAFFDPVTKQGWITNRLRTLFRDKSQHLAPVVSGNEESNVENFSEDNIEDKIAFLKFATQEQKDEIIIKTKETFTFRNKNRENLAERFPRFLDTKGLISFEFKLIHPTIEEDVFVDSFTRYVKVVREVYRTTITRPDPILLRDLNDIDEWDSSTRALITLINLLPPTSSGKSKKGSISNAVGKLIVFQPLQIPLDTILSNKTTNQPFILASGTSKGAVSEYYIVFDQHIVPSTSNDIVSAFDLCFKLHYVFNLKFEKLLEQFYKFVQLQFYGMKLSHLPSRIRELRIKFNNFTSNPLSVDN